jgi:CBS-domain-containing membrane protein
MRTDIPTIRARSSLKEGFRLMQDSTAPAVAVLDGAGRLIGLVTHENIGEMIMVRSARPKGFQFRRVRGTATGPGAIS